MTATHRMGPRLSRRVLATLAVLPAMFAVGGVAAVAEPLDDWNIEHAEITSDEITVGAADSATMPDGSYRIFAVTNSAPDSYLVEIDPWEGEVVESHELRGTPGSHGVHVAPDGTVWAGSYGQGIVYELPWQSETLVEHPPATSETSFVWEVDTDEAGNLYGGTYGGFADPVGPAHLIRIAPNGEQHVYEPFRETDTYVRSTAAVGDKVYAGTGPRDAQIFEVDPLTGERVAIAVPEELGTCTFVYGLTAVGDQLAAQFQDCDHGDGLVGYVLDPETRTWLPGEIPVYSGAVSQPAEDGTLYVGAQGRVAAFDPQTGDIEHLSDGARYGTQDVELTTDPTTGAATVMSIDSTGTVIRHNLEDGTDTSVLPEGLTGDSGRTARTAVVGPDDAYYVSLRRNGGLGRFDPAEGTWTYEPGIGQAQGMTVHDDVMYIGLYPTARIMAYDPSEDWSEGNPHEIFRLDGDGQDRPFAMVSAGDLLAIGTVPDYGLGTGALTIYDPDSGEVAVHSEPFTDRSVIALDYHDGVLYGGTAIYGGGGWTPVRTEGTAFAWDIATETMLWETVPLPGETGIGAVTVDERGRLFVASVGQVAEINPDTGAPLQTAVVTDDTSDQLYGSWHISDLNYNEVEGALYLSTGREIVRLLPTTLEDITPAPTAGELLRVAEDGTNFWMSGRAVHTGTLEPLQEAQVVEPGPVTFTDEDGTAGDSYTVPNVEGVEYLLDGAVIGAGTYPGEGEVTVTARAAEGYVLAEDATTQWSHTFDTTDSSPTESAPTQPDPGEQDSGAPGTHDGSNVGTDPEAGDLPATGADNAGIGAAAALALITVGIALVLRKRYAAN